MIKSGLIVITRMNEVITVLITLIFFVLIVILLPTVDIKNLTPISYLDIIPVLKGSVGPTGLIYFIYFLFFSHKISDKENLFKEGVKAEILLWIICTLVIITSVGNIGHSIISKAPLSFLIAVKQINLLGVLTGFESILVASWILADFILIIIFTYSLLHMLKSLFSLSDYKPLINILLILIGFLSMVIALNVFELQAFTTDFVIQTSIIFQVIIPILIFLIGKLRKKV